jgi:exosortase/archaeosortase
MNLRESSGIFLRYAALVLIALPNLYLFYLVFTPLTIYPVSWILSLFYNVALNNNSLFINDVAIQIIPACIAGSAYYLLLVLNLATPMDAKTRIKSAFFLVLSLLLFNILRLVIFSSLLLAEFSYFDLAHRAVWYFGSTLFVVIIWFVNVYLFRIKSIPAYTDVMSFIKEIKPKGKRYNSRK